MLNVGLHAFVERPDALAWRPHQMAEQGFTSIIVHALAHDQDVPWFAQAVRLRDEARAAGIGCYCWQTVHPGADPDACAAKLASQFVPVKHWDGAVPNLEAIVKTPAGDMYCAELDRLLPHDVELGVSTEPTFPLTAGLRLLERRNTTLLQQAYELENGHTPTSVRAFAVDRPPVYIGWTYWCDFLRLPDRPIRRVYAESQQAPGVFVLKEGYNRWQLDELSRRVYNRQTGKLVGMLRGIWRLPLVAPTVRTTPHNGQWKPAAHLIADLVAALFVNGNLADRGGLYLAETTQDPDDWWLP